MPLTKKELIAKIMAAGDDEAGPFMSTPAENIKGYYGGEENLRKELDIADKYSEENMFNKVQVNPLHRGPYKRKDYFYDQDIKDRMFEELPVYVEPGRAARYRYRDEEGNPTAKVFTGGEKSADISLHNTAFKLDLLNKENRTPEEESRLQKLLENTKFNEYENFGDSVEMEGGKLPKDTTVDSYLKQEIGSGLEHEMGHHVYLPSESKKYPVSTDLKRSYFDDEAELFQALGKFQREHFKEKGQRLTRPEDLYKLLKSDEKFDYLSKEAKRLINYLRKEEKGSKGEERIKFISELAPMFVSNGKSSFENAVEQRLTS
tara:strand:- start:7147 stop:8100 length:954 start_codon:yes stop_codon:yes gene_type:complete